MAERPMSDEEIFEDQVRSVSAARVARMTSRCLKFCRDELETARSTYKGSPNKFEQAKLDAIEIAVCRIIERIKATE